MKKNVFLEGVRDGIPIALGYFAVSFSLGIVAKKATLSPLQGFIASWFNLASAGEFALFNAISEGATYAAVALATLVINARYMLMSFSLSQKFSPDTKFYHRLLVGFGITDEIFGISIARPGNINPLYNYGALSIAVPFWSIGTALGIIAGNFLPARIVSALSVALFGMFTAIFIPPAKKNPVIFIAVLASFILSWAFSVLPILSKISSGTKTIILTVIIASVCALIKPVDDQPKTTESAGNDKNAGTDGTTDSAYKNEE